MILTSFAGVSSQSCRRVMATLLQHGHAFLAMDLRLPLASCIKGESNVESLSERVSGAVASNSAIHGSGVWVVPGEQSLISAVAGSLLVLTDREKAPAVSSTQEQNPVLVSKRPRVALQKN